MAVEFNTNNVSGFESLFKRMDELRDEIGKGKTDRIWRESLKYAMEPVLQDAKSFAPKRSGQLEEHIYLKVHKPQARDKASITYKGEMYLARVTSSPVRDESVLQTKLNKRGKFQSYYTGLKPVGLSQEFGNARVPAHPFLRPALTTNIENIQTRLAQALKVQIDKLAEGKK